APAGAPHRPPGAADASAVAAAPRRRAHRGAPRRGRPRDARSLQVVTAVDLDEFVDGARAFLDAHATRRPSDADEFRWGEGDDFVGIVEEGDPDTEAQTIAAAQMWAATRFDAGYGWITGPPELGGAGLSGEHL